MNQDACQRGKSALTINLQAGVSPHIASSGIRKRESHRIDKFHIKINCQIYRKTSNQILDSLKTAQAKIHVQKLTYILPFIVTKIKCTFQTIKNQNENIVVK
jgi:hypothetical protein